MPLVFSPLSEDILSRSPRKLLPRHAFLMRQLGKPAAVDVEMTGIVRAAFKKRGIRSIDAGDTAGQNDFLERILGLIRSTAFTVAIFSHETRAESLANIMLELGFAAMCGKPLMVFKSSDAKAPSDLSRTDWIVYELGQTDAFKKKIHQATDEILELIGFENLQLEVALNAPIIDCATAMEKVNKAFLLSGQRRFIDAARTIFGRLDGVGLVEGIGDLNRIRSEADIFIRQAEAAVAAAEATGRRKPRDPRVPAAPLPT